MVDLMDPKVLVRLLNEEQKGEKTSLIVHLHFDRDGKMYSSSFTDCTDRWYDGYSGRLTDTRYADGGESYTEWAAFAMSPSAYKRFKMLVA